MLKTSRRRLRWRQLHRKPPEEFTMWRSKNLFLNWSGRRRSQIEWTGKGVSSFCRASELQRIWRELGYDELVKTDAAIRRTIEWERRISPLETSLSTLDYAAEDSALAKLALSSEMPRANDLTEGADQ